MPFNAATSAGAYPMTLAASAVGECTDGKKIVRTLLAQTIAGSDIEGDTPMGAISRGASLKLRLTFREWKAIVVTAIYPFSGTNWLAIPPVGPDHYDAAVIAVGTVTSATPAATTGPASWTLAKVIPAVGFSLETLFNSVLRETTIEFECYPESGVSPRRWGTLS